MSEVQDLQEQEEYRKQIKESVSNGSYFNDAIDWYIFRYVSPICDRTLLFLVSIVGFFASYVLFEVIKQALPIHQEIPIFIKAADSSLYFPVIKSLRSSPDKQGGITVTADEAILRYVTISYLKNREEYDFRNADVSEVNTKFHKIRNTSSVQEYRLFQQFVSKDNPASPILNFGKNVTRKIEIDSLNFKKEEQQDFAEQAKNFLTYKIPSEVEIRYTAHTNNNGEVTKQKFLAKIVYKFSGIKLKEGNKRLDFIVTSYKNYLIK